jgi:hypothetical protein
VTEIRAAATIRIFVAFSTACIYRFPIFDYKRKKRVEEVVMAESMAVLTACIFSSLPYV